jgi:NAD(P)-dependent dehydrogenase (short-subunit alcohol dehydrogenase family)
MLLEGKVVVVTGAGAGIGRAVAVELAGHGAHVVVNGLSADPIDDLIGQIRTAGGQATGAVESVATMEGGRRIIQVALDACGKLDGLVCNAGILRPNSLFDLTETEWDEVLETNLKGYFSVLQPAAKLMRDQGSGSIVMMTSSGGLEGSVKQPNYAASKEAILGLMRSAALALAPDITCNAVSPSALTRMQELIRPGHNPGSPEDIAPLVTFLLSDKARHLTGQVIGAAGERISLYPQPRPARSMFRQGGWDAEAIAAAWDANLGSDRLVRWERFVAGR